MFRAIRDFFDVSQRLRRRLAEISERITSARFMQSELRHKARVLREMAAQSNLTEKQAKDVQLLIDVCQQKIDTAETLIELLKRESATVQIMISKRDIEAIA